MHIFEGRRDSDGRKKAEAYGAEEAGRQSGEKKNEYKGAGAGQRNRTAGGYRVQNREMEDGGIISLDKLKRLKSIKKCVDSRLKFY